MANCINCGGEVFKGFFVEEIPCAHCHEINEVEYMICVGCGLVGKFIDGELVSGAVFTDEDTQQLFDTDVNQLIELFGSLTESQESDAPMTSMKDMIHNCLRCDTPAFEKKRGLWHCPECGFEWEVIPGV